MIFMQIMFSFILISRLKSRVTKNNLKLFSTSDSQIFASLCNLTTVYDAYKFASDYFTRGGIPDAESSARFLVCDATKIGYRMSDFNRNRIKSISDTDRLTISSHIERRLKREPVQYIIGNWDFFGHIFECLAHILIPRPETEELVEKVLSSLQSINFTNPRILDIGTGTGVIGISLLSAIPNATCTAIDINPEAITLAVRNAKVVLRGRNPERFKCIYASFDKFVEDLSIKGYSQCFDIIVSNPPYIPTHEMDTLAEDVKEYESEVALHGGFDGLEVVRSIVVNSPKLLSESGTNEVWLEVSESHPDKVTGLFHNRYRDNCLLGKSGLESSISSQDSAFVETIQTCYTDVKGFNDLSGNPRFIMLKRSINGLK